MTPQEIIPARSNLWLGDKTPNFQKTKLFDPITVWVIIIIILITLVFFLPIISNFTFEEVFFTPLVPFLFNIFAIFNIGQETVLKSLYIFSFLLSSIGIYILVLDMTRRQITSILASVMFVIWPIPIFILIFFKPGLYGEGANWISSFFTIVYGDTAHFLALSIMPYTIILFQRYLKTARTIYFSTTVMSCALILLINRTQSLNLLLVLSVVALNSLLLGQARIKIRRLFFVIIFSIGLVTFWYTPSFWIKTFGILNTYIILNFKYIFPLPIILAVIGTFFSFVFFGKNEDRRLIFISFLLFIAFGVITADWLLHFRSFIPYHHRLIPNFNMFTAIVFALSMSALLDKLKILEIIKISRWSKLDKIAGTFIFITGSFLGLVGLVLVVSPVIINVLSGSAGYWQKIKQQINFETQNAIDLAGGNLKLVQSMSSYWQLTLGIIITAFFLIWLVALTLKALAFEDDEKTSKI